MLLYFQLKSIIKNRTGIEDWILDKAVYRRKMMAKAAEEAGETDYQIEPFVYPYDLGKTKNVLQVLNFTCLPVGDGTSWPVVDGCDQYSLTVSFKLHFKIYLTNFFSFQAGTISTESGEKSKNATVSNRQESFRIMDASAVSRIQSLHSSAFDRWVTNSSGSWWCGKRYEMAKALAVWRESSRRSRTAKERKEKTENRRENQW